MHFSRLAPAVAGLVGAAHAHFPGSIGGVGQSPATFDCGSSWDNEVLFDGIVAAETETDAAISFGLNLKEAQLEGDISIQALEDFAKDSTLRLDLAGVKAYFELDLSASAAVYQTVELVASPELSVDAGLLELELRAAFALDLIVGVNAAVDLSAGFYVSFQEGDYLDICVLTKEVVNTNLEGLLTKALPVGVGADVDLSAEIEVQLGLRLRSHIAVGADVDLLGLDVLEAGAEIAIWADLLSHTITLVETSDCLVSVTNDFVLSLGVGVDVYASVLDILDISLAPEVTVILAKNLGLEICREDRGTVGEFLRPAVEDDLTEAPAVEDDLAEATATPSAPGSDSDFAFGSGSASISGSGSGSAPASVTGSATASVNATITSNGLVTSTATTTKVYTITSCHASVPNCPASETQKIVTSTIISSVTVCPATQTAEPTTSSKTKKPVHTINETLTTIVPCKPTTSTYTPPKDHTTPIAPTVTITDSKTVCPVETGTVDMPEPTGVPSVPAPAPTGPTGPVESPTSHVPVPTTPNNPEVPEAPTSKVPEAPTTEAPEVPTEIPEVPTTEIPQTWIQPAPNSTWTSVTAPHASTTWAPPPAVTPTQPPAGAAGSVKVGMALAMPALVALLF
ncbi:uncharacterized protein J7T54_007190 [Emericellopsis cladophorae]|uniref:Uncharacterized protein n=1 Tax=Emericellopsis cladophorae TaxID=2686198 RepID=A0A9Q0BBK0_9HYPO|nr:uncharacterized protein J7T54_007190 [Emericellopsis cladophorae]KAI6778144.1 hypothetical protein J7T54_007190 [Emericellopsis cladophorae]